MPPIVAGNVGAAESRSMGLPAPLTSMPAYGLLRITGLAASVTFEVQVRGLALEP